MKKIIALGLIIFCLSFHAIAELPDISGLSNDELLRLQTAIIEEMGARKELPSFTAPIGDFEAGSDFPVGKYLITSPTPGTDITIFNDIQSLNADRPVLKKTTLYRSSQGSIAFDFKEGMIVNVGLGPARFEPYTGLVFE